MSDCERKGIRQKPGYAKWTKASHPLTGTRFDSCDSAFMSWIELSHSFYASFFPEALQANEYQSDPGTAVSERYGRSSRYALLEQPHGTQEIPQAAPSGPEAHPCRLYLLLLRVTPQAPKNSFILLPQTFLCHPHLPPPQHPSPNRQRA
ncbi:hypothetical protein TIFTF001_043814 [Ficus carica]|uniref:Uncharacterized protein n=1 Tax=Ficus carica TaxID=3494 RepID=A0AA87YY94_FICCA|nr:hypothetical protein TIFTF001_043814 [Ficus carica]